MGNRLRLDVFDYETKEQVIYAQEVSSIVEIFKAIGLTVSKDKVMESVYHGVLIDQKYAVVYACVGLRGFETARRKHNSQRQRERIRETFEAALEFEKACEPFREVVWVKRNGKQLSLSRRNRYGD